MRVMLLYPISVGGERGDMRRMFRIAEMILHRGHELFILAPDFKIGSGYKLFVTGVRFVDRILLCLQLLILYPLAYMRFKPDLILVRTPLFLLIATFFKIFNRKPLVVDSFMPYPRRVIKTNFKLTLHYMLYKLCVKHIDLFTVEDKVKYRYVIQNGAPKQKVFLLPPGIKLRQVPQVYNKRMFYLSFLYKNRKFEMFLKKLASRREDLPEFKLDICGYGPEEDRYKKMVKELGLEDNVHFLGRVSNERISKIIKNYRVCLLMNTPGQKAYDYLSYGKPILALKSKYNEYVLDGAALLAKDMDDYVTKMGLILKSKRLTRLYASKSKKLAKERYEIGYVSEKFDRALRNIISKTN